MKCLNVKRTGPLDLTDYPPALFETISGMADENLTVSTEFCNVQDLRTWICYVASLGFDIWQ